MTKQEMLAQALQRASNPTSIINIQTVFEAAYAKGLGDAMPGENVLTFNAWKAKGRMVNKGEKALCFLTVFFDRTVKDFSSGESKAIKMVQKTAVFHISQTKKMEN